MSSRRTKIVEKRIVIRGTGEPGQYDKIVQAINGPALYKCLKHCISSAGFKPFDFNISIVEEGENESVSNG